MKAHDFTSARYASAAAVVSAALFTSNAAGQIAVDIWWLLPEGTATESRVTSFTSYGPMGLCGGQLTNANATTDACIWRNTGTGPANWTLITLSDLGGSDAAVNSFGLGTGPVEFIAGGYANTAGGIDRPIVWTSSNNGNSWVRRVLPRLHNQRDARVLAVDRSNLAMLLAFGYSIAQNNVQYAVVWESVDNGVTWTLAHDLEPLAPGQDAEVVGGWGHDRVVGTAQDAQGIEQPVMWDESLTPTQMPAPVNATGGQVNDFSMTLSTDGIAAGATFDAQGVSTPCFWQIDQNGDATWNGLPLPLGYDAGEVFDAEVCSTLGAPRFTLVQLAGQVSNGTETKGVVWTWSEETGNIELTVIDDLHGEPWSAVTATGMTVSNWDVGGQYVGVVGNAILNQDGGTGMHAYVGVPATAAKLTRAVVNRGTLISGTLTELAAWDDAEFTVRYDQNEPQFMQTTINAKTLVAGHDTLEVIILSNSTEPAGTGKLRLRNFATGTWQQVHTWPTGMAETLEIVEDLDTANYVNANGVIQMQLRYSVPVSFGFQEFDTFIDLVEVRVR